MMSNEEEICQAQIVLVAHGIETLLTYYYHRRYMTSIYYIIKLYTTLGIIHHIYSIY